MGYGFGAICKGCGTSFDVNQGAGMVAIPYHCEVCGKERWMEHSGGEPLVKIDPDNDPFTCDCGGHLTSEAPPRCPKCRSKEFDKDPSAAEILYD